MFPSPKTRDEGFRAMMLLTAIALTLLVLGLVLTLCGFSWGLYICVAVMAVLAVGMLVDVWSCAYREWRDHR